MTSVPTPAPRWLLGGAVLGLALALGGLIDRPGGPGLPPGAAARVNETLIGNEAYRDALERFGMDSREALSDGDRRWVLDRLIDEELLLQQGLTTGLVARDRALRDGVVKAVIDRVVAEARASPLSEAELERWYRDNLGLFRSEPAFRIAAWRGTPGAAATAATPAALDADPALAALTLPSGPLRAAKLRDYLGATAAAAIAAADSGQVLTLTGYNDEPLTVLVVERIPGALARFDSERERIEAAWRRDRADAGLRDYLATLRRHATIEIAGHPPP
ncbi:MAG: hypothetical protein AAFX58_01805 [Pseudomonadota bacterium]